MLIGLVAGEGGGGEEEEEEDFVLDAKMAILKQS